MNSNLKCKRTPVAAGVAAALCLTFTASPAMADRIEYASPPHIFSTNDVQGGFDGSTYGPGGSIQDPTILCPSCSSAYVDKNGVAMIPVDSEFGFVVEDFVSAAQKTRNNDYEEGFVGDLTENSVQIGLQVSNAPTDTFKVKTPLGTWCLGLGSTSVKCSTEHYTTMESLLTCHETIPYKNADEITGTQQDLIDPATGAVVDNCATQNLDNDLLVLVNGIPSFPLMPDADGNPDLEPNESTVRDQIAASTEYAITKKDDGKPLYRFGNMIKRPNDIRLYAKLDLPQEWKDNPDMAYTVYRAELVVEHQITNNPNDQLRPEDLENEAATGRLPAYAEDSDGLWRSTRDCYESDGDFIPRDTVFRNPPFTDRIPQDPSEFVPGALFAYSSDLRQGLTNGWYTTIDRDPFESDPVSGKGPRWRLKVNKFGQDIPGLEIPLIECSQPPFAKDNIKYVVGERTVTTINLLDWDDGESPLSTSQGWIDPAGNGFNEIAQEVNGVAVSVNGLPITEDFDLGLYIKGDAKATAVFNATLYIEYEGDGSGEPIVIETVLNVTDDAFVIAGSTKNYGSSTTVSVVGPDVRNGFFRQDIDEIAGKTVRDASLTLNISNVYKTGNLRLHRVLSTWTESSITGTTQPSFEATPFLTFPVTGPGLREVDVSGLVSDWADGSAANYGIAITSDTASVRIDSTETKGGMPATITVTYEEEASR